MTMSILAESAIRITVLALGVAVVLRLLRIRAPHLAHHAWTAVLALMLVLPATVAWGPKFETPLFGSVPTVGHLLTAATGDAGAAAPGAARSTVLPSDRTAKPIAWEGVAVTVYAAGVVVLLVQLARGAWRLRTIRRTVVVERGLLTHPACVTPIAVGILDASVILPSDWTDWDETDASAILAHELEHVRRADPLIVAVALLNRAIFWFHPLAWWLPRELSRLAEQACDAAVISQGHDRDVYASCLLRFACRARDAGGRVLPMATAMSGAGLQARLRLLAGPPASSSPARLVSLAGVCAALAAVCAAVAPAAATVQGPGLARAGQMPWPVVSSAHFEVFHAGLPADRVGGAIRDAEAAYQQLSADFVYDIAWRVPIILVTGDRDLPIDATGGNTLALLSGAPARRHVILSLESLDRRAGIAVHELTHQFAFEMMPRTSRVSPLLIEGLAEHQRGAWQSDDLRQTRAAAAAGAIPPVALIDGSGRHWAHAMFDYVSTAHGVEGVRQLVFGLGARETLAAAVPVALGVTLDQFDRNFRDYVISRFGQR